MTPMTDLIPMRIPCKTWVRKYCLWQYRFEGDIIVHQNNVVGRELYRLLHVKNHFNTRGGRLLKDETFFEFKVSVRSLRSLDCTRFTREIIEDFNQTMDVWMKKDFIDFMEHNSGRLVGDKKLKKVDLMDEFRDRYGLTEEHLPIEMLKKYEFRKLVATESPYFIR